MDPITRQAIAVAGGAGAGDPVYVDDVFSTFLYEGNSSQRTIANGIDLSGEGGLVWIKNRGVSGGWGIHFLFDTERSPTNSSNKYYLRSDSTAAQAASTTDSTKDFGGWASNGFLLGPSLGLGTQAVNGSSNNYVSWTFRKAPGFFDIVTWTGDGTTSRTISHNLGSVPGMIIVKRLNDSDNWQVYHRSIGATKCLQLNQNYSASTASNRWNDTEPTSTVFTVANTSTNSNGKTYVAYVFAHDDQSFGTNSDEAIIKCGSYTGNGSTPGVTLDLGFEPQFLLIKNISYTDATSNWMMFDMMRGLTAQAETQTQALTANLSTAEGGQYVGSGNTWAHPTSTGFMPGNSANATNRSGDTMIYMAIRRPHKPPTAGTEVLTAAYARSPQSSQPPAFDSNNHVVDFGMYRRPATTEDWYTTNRLTGNKYMLFNSTASASSSGINYDHQHGFGGGASTDYFAYMLRRAPGFMDVVAYRGTGSQQTISHNLGVTPELFILKNRNGGGAAAWDVWAPSAIGITTVGMLYSTNQWSANGNLSAITSSSWATGTNSGGANTSGNDFIVYLFASLSGISKVGTYSGTGYNINVDCGFTAGARFILIKRTNSSGDWYVWDSTRGIVSGNDPYWLFNSTAVQVTNTDYIDPLNAGFTVTSSAPAALNASGGTYLFLAIA